MEKMKIRQNYRNHWHTDLLRAPQSDPLFCCFSLWCGPCASYILRKRALYNDMSRYTCCGGYMPCSGRCGESHCPELCLCTEVFLCFANSVASTRFMLQDEFNLQTTKCDNCIIETMNFKRLLGFSTVARTWFTARFVAVCSHLQELHKVGYSRFLHSFTSWRQHSSYRRISCYIYSRMEEFWRIVVVWCIGWRFTFALSFGMQNLAPDESIRGATMRSLHLACGVTYIIFLWQSFFTFIVTASLLFRAACVIASCRRLVLFLFG
ncbi:uncharacterized protein [Nicotiana sylvestris]|uniref:uncharacterized protein isoform X2 n=1 Tax=Nicotiana sylvestris TaxID=4096 RepID=UPI00388C9DB7